VKALRCGDAVFQPVVRRKGEGFEVELDGRTWEVAFREEQPGVFVLEGQPAVRFHLARDGAKVLLSWAGVVYELEEVREGRASRRHDSGALEAPMPGRVAAVRVEAGSPVTKGQELLVVEAMKMENALRAPRDGVVQAVHVAVGDMVAPGRPLVELEAVE
jgi:3-methylcrotonyl-CoA carboxylase alpha subunit